MGEDFSGHLYCCVTGPPCFTCAPAAALREIGQSQPLLADLPYADWLLEPRQRLEDLYLESCFYVAEAYLLRRQWEAGQAWLCRALQPAPWLERGWQMLMRLYARQGQRALALKAYQDTAAALERELWGYGRRS